MLIARGCQNRPVPPDAKTVSGSKTVMSRTMLPSDANPYGNVHGGEGMTLDLDSGSRLNYWFVGKNQLVQYSGTADLYVFFYLRALQLLAPNGMLVFISSITSVRVGIPR